MSKQIIVVKPNSLTPEGKALLLSEGVIVIEHENPAEARVIDSIDGYTGDDVFNAAIDAILQTQNTDVPKTKFANKLLLSIQKKRQSNP